MKAPDGFRCLLERAQRGDEQAFNQMFTTAQTWVHQELADFGRRAGPDASTADLAQAAWLQAWRRLDQFAGGPDDAQTLAMFQGWIRRVARGVGINAVRDRRRDKRRPPGGLCSISPASESSARPSPVEPIAGGPSPSALVMADEQAQQVRASIARLPEHDRLIIQLRFVEGLSLREMGRMLALPHETVRKRFHELLAQMAAQLDSNRRPSD